MKLHVQNVGAPKLLMLYPEASHCTVLRRFSNIDLDHICWAGWDEKPQEAVMDRR